MEANTLQDDCTRLVRILSDAPPEGMSYEEIQTVCVATGEPWSFRTITNTLVALGRQVKSEKNRPSGKRKATRFKLNLGA
jgi:hypothetical protein